MSISAFPSRQRATARSCGIVGIVGRNVFYVAVVVGHSLVSADYFLSSYEDDVYDALVESHLDGALCVVVDAVDYG